MWFYYVVFFALIVTFVVSNYYKKEQKTIVFVYAFLMLFAGLRPGDCCNDYWNYVELFKTSRSIGLFQLEPTFFVIVAITNLLSTGTTGFFILYALVALLLKYFAIRRLTQFHFLTLIYFFGYFFLVHEMTQIRTAVATGFLLLSIKDLKERTAFKFYLKIFLGSLFHYSFLFFGFFYFLKPKTYNPILFCLLPLVGYVMFFGGINLVKIFDLIHLQFLSEKINAYKSVLEVGGFSEINVVNTLMIVRILFLIFLSINHKKIYESNEYFYILLKIYSFSLFFFPALADLPVFAFRISELLGIVEIILIPFVLYFIKPVPVAVTAVILIAFGMLSFQLFYAHLIFDYFGQ
jgi:hypothetical protein